MGISNGKRLIGKIVVFLITATLAFLFVAPVFFAFISAFKTNGEILKSPISMPEAWNLNNFRELFDRTNFLIAIRNSLILTVVSEILIVFIVPMAAYAVERRKSKLTSLIYTLFIAGMMIPFHMYMFPLFKMMKFFGIFGTLAGPITSYVAGSVAFGTLLYSGFLKNIPLEIEEAAKIDGCTPFQTFWKVVFPLLGPCTASMIVLNGLNIWNDFLLPYLALSSDEAKTIMVEVYSFVGQFTSRWDIVFAGTVIAIVPALVVYVSLQQYFVKGITAGSSK